MNSLIFSYFTLLQWYILAKVKVVRSIYHINVLRIAVFKGSILMGKISYWFYIWSNFALALVWSCNLILFHSIFLHINLIIRKNLTSILNWAYQIIRLLYVLDLHKQKLWSSNVFVTLLVYFSAIIKGV